MFIKNQFTTLFDYHWHTNQRLISCAAEVSHDDYFAKPGDGLDSIHEILFHILRADSGWRAGLETGVQQLPLAGDDYPDLEALKSGFEREQVAWGKLLDSLTAEQIKAKITLRRANGAEMDFFFWRILQHVVFHGMQHQSELAHLLTSKGHSPGDIDFLFFA